MEGTESNYPWYVGIDWGAERYEVCVLDRQAQVVARRSIAHSGTGIAEFVDWLVKLCEGKPERLIRSRWTGFGTGTRWREPRMTVGMRSFWGMHCGPTNTAF